MVISGDSDDGDSGGEDPNGDLCFDEDGFNFDLDGDGYVDSESVCDYYLFYEYEYY